MNSTLSSSRFIGAVAGLSLALIWLLPFILVDHRLPIATFWQEWTAAVLLISAIVCVLAQAPGALALSIPGFIFAPLGLAIVIAVQFALGKLNFPAQYVIPLLYLMLAIFACCLGKTLASNGSLERFCTWIAISCVVGGIFNTGIQIAQLRELDHLYFFMSHRAPDAGLFGNVNQVNHLAAYLGLGLGAVMYLRVIGRISLTGSWMALIFLSTGLTLTGQRSAMVYAFVPLIVTLLAWRSLHEHRISLLKFGLVQPIAFAMTNIVIKLLAQDQSPLLPAGKLLVAPFYDARWIMWKHSMAMFWSHPFLGVGFDQFWPHYFEQLDVLGGAEGVTHPHNLIAALLSETGLIGALSILIPTALWIWRTRLAATSIMQWFGFIQVLIIGFHSMIEYPLWYAYFLIIAAFWLGAIDPIAHTAIIRYPQRAAAALLLIASIALADIATTYRRFTTQIWAISHPRITNLVQFTATRSNQLVDLTDHWFFHREMAFWLPALITTNPDHLADKLAINTNAMKVAPSSINLFRQVLLLVLSGKVEDATQLLARAKQIYPGRYIEMQQALPLAALKWPAQFEPAMKRLTGS